MGSDYQIFAAMQCPVGTDVLICPAERSLRYVWRLLTPSRALLDWTAEDSCPYVVRGGSWTKRLVDVDFFEAQALEQAGDG